MGRSVFCSLCKIKHSRPVGKRCHIALALSASLQQERNASNHQQVALSTSAPSCSNTGSTTPHGIPPPQHHSAQGNAQIDTQMASNPLDNSIFQELRAISARLTVIEDERARSDTVTSTPKRSRARKQSARDENPRLSIHSDISEVELFSAPGSGAATVAVTTATTTLVTCVAATAGIVQSSPVTSVSSLLQNGAGCSTRIGASTHGRFSSQDPHTTTSVSVSLPALYPMDTGRSHTTQPFHHQVSSTTNNFTNPVYPSVSAIPQHNPGLSVNQPMISSVGAIPQHNLGFPVNQPIIPSVSAIPQHNPGPMMQGVTNGMISNPQVSSIMAQGNHQMLTHSVPISNSFTGQPQVCPQTADGTHQGLPYRPQQTLYVDYSGG